MKGRKVGGRRGPFKQPISRSGLHLATASPGRSAGILFAMPRCAIPILLTLLVPTAARSQDSTVRRRDTTSLAPLEVQVTRGPERRLAVPASVAVADSGAFRGAQLQNGIDEALGRLPGLYVANRFNPSLDQRLVIRGAGARANFGLRGLKVLLDGLPQTLPDGQTQLTNLDLGLVDRAEVLLGGASALYGNAGGGVIAFTSSLPSSPFSARVRTVGGSFGTSRLAANASGTTGPWSGTLGVSRYASNGVRQQSATSATQLSLGVNRLVGSSWLLKGRYYLARSPEARNPGALTRAEYLANPDSAAANNILRGADKSVTQHQLGLTATTSDTRGNGAEVTVFGLTRDLVNPLATAPPGPTGPRVGTYSAIDRVVGGARASVRRRLDDRGTRLSVGADVQTMRDDRVNRRANGGQPTDTIVADQRETVTEIGPFVSLHAEPTSRLTFTATGRWDRVAFRVRDRFLTDGVDQGGTRAMSAVSGSGGANIRITPVIAAWTAVSSAFETPTTTELVNQSNGAVGFNRDLEPQRTVTVEGGLRTAGAVVASLTAYRSSVRDALVQAREQDGRAYFENAGRLAIRGLEAGLSWRPASGVDLTASYTHTDARFSEYRLRAGATTDTLDGLEVPGIPRHVVRAVVVVTIGPLVAEWDQQIVSRYFADDRNTLPVDGWGAGVTALRLRADLAAGARAGRVGLAPFVAVNNLWNRRYLAAATVNGFGGRVYEPAPGRWVFVGLDASFRLGP